jgi:hypothetical protein
MLHCSRSAGPLAEAKRPRPRFDVFPRRGFVTTLALWTIASFVLVVLLVTAYART